MPLTDATIRGLKPKERPYKVADFDGLYVYVSKTGRRTFRMNYTLAGKQKTLTFGSYPIFRLSDARKARDEAKRTLEHGEDPGAKKQEESERMRKSDERSFRSTLYRFLDSREAHWTERYHGIMRRRAEAHLIPDLGARHVGRIEPPELLKVIRSIEEKGTTHVARKMKTLAGQVFKFAIAEGHATRDPSQDITSALKPLPKVKHQPKVPLEKFPELVAAIYDYDGDPLTKAALKLTLHTMVRTAETRFAEYSEFTTGKDSLWRIPEERMKMSRPHLVPLSRQAVEIYKSIVSTRSDKQLVFAADTTSGVISENTMLYALYRLGYHSRQTVHGFRGLASTILHESGFDSNWIEIQLAHDDGDKVRAAYNAAEYLPQRRKMLQWWSDYIDQQVTIGQLL